MSDLAHRNLTDPQLHEPKGASTAPKDSVYISNGIGSGAWGRLNMTQLSFEKGRVDATSYSSVPSAVNLDPSPLTSKTDGKLADAVTFAVNNKNIKELAIELEQIHAQNVALKENLVKVQGQLTAVVAALESSGIITVKR